MGSSHSAPDLARKMRAAAGALERSQQRAVFMAALSAKDVMVASAAAVGVGRRLRGVGTRGASVGVRFDVKGTRNPTALVTWYGPAHLVNNPTRPHTIAPRRRRGKRAVVTPHGPRANATHPGTRGKRFFQAAVPTVQRVAPEVYRRVVVSELTGVFR